MCKYNESIRKKYCFNNVVFVRWKRCMWTKTCANNSFFIAFLFWKLVSLSTYVNYDSYVDICIIFRIQTLSKTKCLNTCIRLSCLKPVEVPKTNYRHLWSLVSPFMPGGNKKSCIRKVPGLFKWYVWTFVTTRH